MKNIFTILATVLLTATLWAQSPEKMSYQAVIRNAEEVLVKNQSIGMKISILQNSSTGTVVYQETQTPTTNINGLVSLEIGSGTVVTGTMGTIDWGNGTYFIKTETDPTGGSNYTITGTSQLLSVPFALHAKEVDPNVPKGTAAGQMQFWNGTKWVIVAPGKEGDILKFINNTPKWVGELIVIDVENPTTGAIWMDRNLGASQVATSLTDADGYGDLYQWGRGSDGHQIRTSRTTATLSTTDNPGHGDFITIATTATPPDWRSPQNDTLWQGTTGINNPCPTGYRIPTEAEWLAERASWPSTNGAGAYASPLKLPMSGQRLNTDGSLSNVGIVGNFWSSTVAATSIRTVGFAGSYTFTGSSRRSLGLSVRCIKN